MTSTYFLTIKYVEMSQKAVSTIEKELGDSKVQGIYSHHCHKRDQGYQKKDNACVHEFQWTYGGT